MKLFLQKSRYRSSLFVLAMLCSLAVFGQTTTENYIQTKECLDASCSKKKETVVYFDGLGREKQALQVGASPEGKTIGVHYEYDGFGRQVKDYLPTPTSSGGNGIVPDLKGTSSSYYQTNYQTGVFYAEKELENSPLNRVLKQAAPGDAWKLGSGHEIKFDYQTNEGIDEVIVFLANTTYNSSENIYQAVLSRRSSNETYGFYPTGSLYKTKTTDENGQSVVEFKNKEGQILLKRIDTAEARFDTYYVYDVYGNLTYVLPPKLLDIYYSQNPLRGDWLTVMNELGYQYRYDDKNRLVEKKLPGKGWESMVYDKQDRLVLTQDAIQKGKEWNFVKYDQYGRVVYTGLFKNTASRVAMQTALNNKNGSNNEIRSSSSYNNNGLTIFYSNTAFPNGSLAVHTVNYYDDYVNLGVTPYSLDGTPVIGIQEIKTKGLAVGSFTNVLGTAQWNKTFTYYDREYIRPITTESQNYLGGFTKSTSTLDFRGKPLQVETHHQRDEGSSPLKVVERFTYDDYAERLLTHSHQINDGKEEVLVQNQYDQLGQLKGKKVGNTLNSPLQQIDYRYNIRGWLTDINNIDDQVSNKLFSFRIGYNEKKFYSGINEVPFQYNGNIAETRWKNRDNIIRSYDYMYDGLNRLTSAIYTKGNYAVVNAYNEDLSYDKNGNILSLIRSGDQDVSHNMIWIDELTYEYKENSNQLMRVRDNPAYAQKGGFIDGNTEGDDYAYDVNGNLTKDLNKGITQIRYNHLNLPTEVLWSSSKKINYNYDASGVKLKKVVTDGSKVTSTDYLGGFQYENNVLQFFPTVEGYVDAANESSSGKPFEYVYNYTDHLGNIRVSYRVNSKGILERLQENDYYPFGMKHQKSSSQKNFLFTKNNYKYNAKEFQDEFNINLYDYGARNYDPVIGRWFNIDPLAEQMRRHSPYNYAFNNPVFFIDPDGMAPEHIDPTEFNKTADANNKLAMKHFVNTKEGYNFFAKYAKAGDEIGGVKFNKAGEYHKAGIDIKVGTEVSVSGASGEAPNSIVDGRLQFSLNISNGSKWASGSMGTIGHESFTHILPTSKDYVDNGKLDFSSGYDKDAVKFIKSMGISNPSNSGGWVDHFNENVTNNSRDKTTSIIQQYYKLNNLNISDKGIHQRNKSYSRYPSNISSKLIDYENKRNGK